MCNQMLLKISMSKKRRMCLPAGGRRVNTRWWWCAWLGGGEVEEHWLSTIGVSKGWAPDYHGGAVRTCG